MTRDEVLKMEPGNDLDILVTEKVFGWQKGTNKFKISGWQWSGRDGKPVLDDSWDGEWVAPFRCVPKYSTDIKTAWEVVKKINERGWHVNIKTYSDGDVVVSILSYLGRFIDDALTQSVPEAICKAALLAVLEEKEEVEK